MIAPPKTKNETLRQKAVEKYKLLDTFPEERYDSITKLMSYICDTPISLITLLDKERNFFKSHHGIPFNQAPRDSSFCGHAINSDKPITIIEDSRKDYRFYDNPIVQEHNTIFYAGAPLVDSDGYKLGMLCVYDTKPRNLTEAQKDALLALSKQVISLFEQHYQNLKLKKTQEKLKVRNANLKKFAAVVSHDLKSPLANISLLTELLKSENEDNFSEDSKQYLNILKESSLSISNYIEGMLDFYRSDDIAKQKHSQFYLSEIVYEVQKMYAHHDNIDIILPANDIEIYSNRPALTQTFLNLIGNAVKYNDEGKIIIKIDLQINEDAYHFSVADNGIGIKPELINGIFNLFETLGVKDRYGNSGTGIGLATIKKIITTLGGDISVVSKVNQGSTFKFYLPK